MTDKQLLLASSLFILMLPAEERNPLGKRLVKKFNRAIKKSIRIHQSAIDREHFLKVVKLSEQVIVETKKKIENIKGSTNVVMIGPLLKSISMKAPKDFEVLNIKKEELEEFIERYDSDGYTFNSLRYCSALLKIIDKIIKENNLGE